MYIVALTIGLPVKVFSAEVRTMRICFVMSKKCSGFVERSSDGVQELRVRKKESEVASAFTMDRHDSPLYPTQTGL